MESIILMILGILLFMFSPIIFVSIYKYTSKLKGREVHEGNSTIYAYGWYAFVTIPVGIIGLIILLIGKAMNYF